MFLPITFVVRENGDDVYLRANSIFLQQWILSYLFCIFRSSNTTEAFLALFFKSNTFRTVDFCINVHAFYTGSYHFWTTVCNMVRPIQSDRCLSCLSVTLVYCGQTVGRIKMKLGTQLVIGPGYIVLDGNPALPPPKRQSPHFSAHICCG